MTCTRVVRGLRILAMLTTVSCIQPRVSGQSGPTIVKSPEIVPYKPVRTADSVKIQPCPADLASLAEPGVTYKMAPGILSPRITRMVGVEMTKEGRQAYKKGLFKDSNEIVSKISVLVNVQGKPESPCLMRPAGFDLDEQSGNAALQYRFEPAQRNGSPIPMRMGIEFRYEAH